MRIMTRIQLLFNDEVSSLTLVEGLASHDLKRHLKINWNHQETKLKMKKCLQRPRHDKGCVFALYGASQRRVTREKKYINNKKTRVSALPSQRECARLHLRCARAHLGVQAPAARHLAVALGSQLTWVCVRSWLLVLERRCAQSHYQGFYSFCLFSTLKPHFYVNDL